jgi:hypothetical protein
MGDRRSRNATIAVINRNPSRVDIERSYRSATLSCDLCNTRLVTFFIPARRELRYVEGLTILQHHVQQREW